MWNRKSYLLVPFQSEQYCLRCIRMDCKTDVSCQLIGSKRFTERVSLLSRMASWFFSDSAAFLKILEQKVHFLIVLVPYLITFQSEFALFCDLSLKTWSLSPSSFYTSFLPPGFFGAPGAIFTVSLLETHSSGNEVSKSTSTVLSNNTSVVYTWFGVVRFSAAFHLSNGFPLSYGL